MTALGGCEPLSPGDSVYLYGRLLDPAGAPVPAVTLAVSSAEKPEPDSRPAFAPLKEVTTGADGRFLLELKVADAWVPENPSARRLKIASPELDGLRVLVTFQLSYGDADLPDLQLWDSRLRWVDPGGPSFRSPPMIQPPEGATYVAGGDPMPNPTQVIPLLALTGATGPIWLDWYQDGEPPPGELLLEDFAEPRAQVRQESMGWWSQEAVLTQRSSQLSFRVEWMASSIALPRGSVVPMSRGANCSTGGDVGPCAWTDGDLRLSPFPSGTEALVVALPSPELPRRAVIRGLFPDLEATSSYPSRVVVEGFADGSWIELGGEPFYRDSPHGPFGGVAFWPREGQFEHPVWQSEDEFFETLPLTGDRPVTSVRLRILDLAEAPIPLASLRELSFFR